MGEFTVVGVDVFVPFEELVVGVVVADCFVEDFGVDMSDFRTKQAK
jgi:hypothetical protein